MKQIFKSDYWKIARVLLALLCVVCGAIIPAAADSVRVGVAFASLLVIFAVLLLDAATE